MVLSSKNLAFCYKGRYINRKYYIVREVELHKGLNVNRVENISLGLE